jgi:dTDP-4-dehydrorhamnose 3,5-epimerase-like enzyme
MEPKKIPIKLAIDDRGCLWQLFDIKGSEISFDGTEYINIPPIKRIYKVENFSKDIIRGMHFHKKEWKFFIVIMGSAKFVISPTQTINEKTQVFVLSDRRPEVLIVPPGYYNGWKALEEKTILLGMSNFSLEESLKDDFRIPPDNFSTLFEVKNR